MSQLGPAGLRPGALAPLWLVVTVLSLLMAACGAGSGSPTAQTDPVVGTAAATGAGTSAAPAGSTAAPAATSGTTTETNTADAATTEAPAGAGLERSPYVGHFEPRVLAEYPHDETAFTQGLEWFDGRLLESTGLNGESSLRLVDPRSGRTEQILAVDNELFAEGVTVVDNQAYQLTWLDGVLLITELPDLSGDATRRIEGAYSSEGWGLCFDGTRLVMSDGTDQLTFRHPQTFDVERRLSVSLRGTPITLLNELECVGGQIWANLWKSNTIVAIDSATGEVEATVDATSLVPGGLAEPTSEVLNGIAYNHDTGTFWLTGKRWPVLYEVEFVGS